VLGISAAAIASSQSAWIGTDWIRSGGLIQSAPLASNLDWLQENKVQKPLDCTGDSNRLTWNNGEWQCEEYIIPTGGSEAPTASNCIFNGVAVSDGESVSAYQSSTAPFGSTCTSESRSCTNGVLSGSFTHSSCTTANPTQCSFAGSTINHGEQRVAYESATVPFGSTCVSQTRSCSNGTLSGSFTNASCAVAGEDIAHGQVVTAYQSSSVESPNTCVSENRTCTNGVLAGSFTNDTCSVISSTPVEPPTSNNYVWSDLIVLTGENTLGDCQAASEGMIVCADVTPGDSCSIANFECFVSITGSGNCAVRGHRCELE